MNAFDYLRKLVDADRGPEGLTDVEFEGIEMVLILAEDALINHDLPTIDGRTWDDEAMRPLRRGSYISGTLHPRDLLPKFLEIARSAQGAGPYDSDFNNIANRSAMNADDPYWNGESCVDDVEFCMARIDDALPEGWHFGPHEGGGSDFGVWRSGE
jgi:hypothetical protein